MEHFRNLAFVILCFVMIGTWHAQPTQALTLSCSIEDVTPGGCIPIQSPNVCHFEGSCPWAVGCGDALSAADSLCQRYEYDNEEYEGWLENFDCEDPLDPPTDFSFSCYFWAIYD
jgi:hypothetical protein